MVIREVILQKMAPILDPVNFFGVFSLLGHCEGTYNVPHMHSFQDMYDWLTAFVAVWP